MPFSTPDLKILILCVQPGCRDKLTISAAPAEVGVHTSVLLFCVKDNPEIVTVNIACSGVVPNVEILPLTKTIGTFKLFQRPLKSRWFSLRFVMGVFLGRPPFSGLVNGLIIEYGVISEQDDTAACSSS